MGYLMRKSMNGASPAQATPATQFPTATPPFVSRTELRKVINNQPCAQAVSLVPNQGASDSQGVFRCCLRAPLQAGATRSEGAASETKRWADRPSWGSNRPTTKESGRRRAAPRRPAAPPGGSDHTKGGSVGAHNPRRRPAAQGAASETKRGSDRLSWGSNRPTTKESGRRRAAPRRPAAPPGGSDHTK